MKENMPNNLEVGERIRKIREELKMNRETFSEMIDISDVFLGQIERGERSLSIKTLCRIVSFTGSSTDFILFGTAKENSTINKINRILHRSSETMISYIYQIIIASLAFFKTHEEE
jgi:transcriptional regulator with XRE-family HTH domain